MISICWMGNVNAQNNDPKLIDQAATKETIALFNHLHTLSKDHILFGHQHATEYGHGWYGGDNRSDVHSVTGSHPAVIGVDFSGLSGRTDALIEKEKTALRKIIWDTYKRGGVTTVSWHFNNPVSPTDFYWNDSTAAAAVKDIIPGGGYHQRYKSILATIADLVHSIKGADGNPVPMIFRPYHEFDGNWFWWGKGHCSREDFISLWRFTVSYLRDTLQVHNFIYAFSPDCTFNSENEFMDRYPGNAWVDLVGMDDYADMGRDRYDTAAAIRKLKIVSGFAEKNGKLAAFTETGLESIPNPEWWTTTLLPVLMTKGLHLSYVLVWRNDSRSPTHYYAPFPGQVSVPDFLKFYKDPFTLFEKDLQGIYR
ncbi:MAG: beta-mannosidase [Terrimonas sp.]|nr:beta-mannosidase [Terrimonas sp.]